MEKQRLLEAYGELIYGLRKLDFIVSLTLIGKDLKDRVFEHIMDIDIVIITKDPMKVDNYKKIEDVFSNVCKKYKTEEADFIYAIAEGPMKPYSPKNEEIFFHCLLHTIKSYKEGPFLLVKNSWQQFKPIFGIPLKEIQSFSGVTKDMLVNSLLGINHLIELVSNDSSAYIGWEESGNGFMKPKIFPLHFKINSEKADLYIYSALRCASNWLRYTTKDNSIGIDGNMASLFKIKFPNNRFKEFPNKLLHDKKILRNKLDISDIYSLKDNCLNFLHAVKQVIE